MTTTTTTQNQIKEDYRNFKLNVIQNNIQFSIDPNRWFGLPKSIRSIIVDYFYDDIITGSVSLYLHGLIDRQIKDIDVVLANSDRFPSYTRDVYGEEADEINIDNRLGYRNFKYKEGFLFKTETEILVDFFVDKDGTYTYKRWNPDNWIATRGIKFHNPFEIIDYKMRMIHSKKQVDDLFNIFNKFQK